MAEKDTRYARLLMTENQILHMYEKYFRFSLNIHIEIHNSER